MASVADKALQSVQEMNARLQAKAVGDPDFRSQLFKDPRGAIRSELGIELPDDVEIQVHEASRSTVHLVVPPDLEEIGEEQLEAVSAGICSGCVTSI